MTPRSLQVLTLGFVGAYWAGLALWSIPRMGAVIPRAELVMERIPKSEAYESLNAVYAIQQTQAFWVFAGAVLMCAFAMSGVFRKGSTKFEKLAFRIVALYWAVSAFWCVKGIFRMPIPGSEDTMVKFTFIALMNDAIQGHRDQTLLVGIGTLLTFAVAGWFLFSGSKEAPNQASQPTPVNRRG